MEKPTPATLIVGKADKDICNALGIPERSNLYLGLQPDDAKAVRISGETYFRETLLKRMLPNLCTRCFSQGFTPTETGCLFCEGGA